MGDVPIRKEAIVPDDIRRIDYYTATVSNKPGEAARILGSLAEAGVSLTAFSGFPEGARKAQLDFMPEDAAAFKRAARQAGVAVSARKTGFLIQGQDRCGALAETASKLAQSGINIVSMQGLCAGAGRYGGLLWVKPEDVRKAAKVLGAS